MPLSVPIHKYRKKTSQRMAGAITEGFLNAANLMSIMRKNKLMEQRGEYQNLMARKMLGIGAVRPGAAPAPVGSSAGQGEPAGQFIEPTPPQGPMVRPERSGFLGALQRAGTGVGRAIRRGGGVIGNASRLLLTGTSEPRNEDVFGIEELRNAEIPYYATAAGKADIALALARAKASKGVYSDKTVAAMASKLRVDTDVAEELAHIWPQLLQSASKERGLEFQEDKLEQYIRQAGIKNVLDVIRIMNMDAVLESYPDEYKQQKAEKLLARISGSGSSKKEEPGSVQAP